MRSYLINIKLIRSLPTGQRPLVWHGAGQGVFLKDVTNNVTMSKRSTEIINDTGNNN
jgi:hypothetical protein